MRDIYLKQIDSEAKYVRARESSESIDASPIPLAKLILSMLMKL